MNKIAKIQGIRIIGPPGVAKSITVWSWVCHQVKLSTEESSALWVNLGASPTVLSVTKSGIDVPYVSDDALANYIRRSADYIIVVDGVTKLDYHRQLGKNHHKILLLNDFL